MAMAQLTRSVIASKTSCSCRRTTRPRALGTNRRRNEMAKRILKVHGDIRLVEVTLSDGTNISNRAYAVGTRDPGAFGDVGSASAYFDVLVLRSLNPPK